MKMLHSLLAAVAFLAIFVSVAPAADNDALVRQRLRAAVVSGDAPPPSLHATNITCSVMTVTTLSSNNLVYSTNLVAAGIVATDGPQLFTGVLTNTGNVRVVGNVSISGRLVAATGPQDLTGVLTNTGAIVGTANIQAASLIATAGPQLLTGVLTNTGNVYVIGTLSASTGFSGAVTNISTLSTNIEVFVGGICTNTTRNP